MFAKVAGFEFRYQVRSPVFWVAFGIFFLLTYGATTIPQIHIGSGGNTHVNAPYAILEELGIMSVFAIFALTAFVANVVVRDDETGFGPIIRSTRITKFDYLFGRFTGAYCAAAVMILSLPLGIIVGSMMPWLDPVKVGPFRPEDYLYAYSGHLASDPVGTGRRLLRACHCDPVDDGDLCRCGRVSRRVLCC